MVATLEEHQVNLTCGVCENIFKQPYILSCLHSFCFDCVTSPENIQQDASVRCPSCEQESHLHEGTVRPNYFFSNSVAVSVLRSLNNDSVSCGNCEGNCSQPEHEDLCVFCEECCEYLCDNCIYCHQNTKLTRNHNLIPRQIYEQRLRRSGEERAVYCRLHNGKLVEQYCLLCDEPICTQCDSHSEHNKISLREAFKSETGLFKEALSTATSEVNKHEKCASRCCNTIDELRARKMELNERIAGYFAAYKERIEKYEQKLLKMVLTWYDSKYILIKNVQKEEEVTVDKISNALKLSQALLEHGTDVEVLSLKNIIHSQLTRVANKSTGDKCITAVQEAIRSASWNSNDTPDLVFPEDTLRLPEVKREQKEKIKFAEAELTRVECFPEKSVEESSVPQTESKQNEGLQFGIEGRDFKLGAVIPGGKMNLWQKFRDAMISRGAETKKSGRDYRYDKIVRNRTIGRRGTGYGEFYHPCDIAVDKQRHDRIIVTDYNNDRVQVFNHFGDFLFTFGGRGSKLGKFLGPSGVAVLSNGAIVVADSLNNRVQIFTSRGKYYSSFGEEGRRLGQFWRPMGVTVDGTNRIIVVDQGNNRVQVYDSNGDFCFAFGQLGHWDGEMSCPNFVAVDNDDNIYVSDEVNLRIQIFDRHGTFLRKIASQEVHGYNGNLGLLSGIAVDSRGYVIVSRKNACGVQVFTPDGRFLRSFLSKYSTTSRLQFTSGIALTSVGEIVVADWLNNRVRFF